MFGLAEPDEGAALVSLAYVTLPHHAGLPALAYEYEGDSGFDLRAAIPEPLVLWPGQRAIIPTGIRFVIPPGYEVQVRSRSGLAINNGVVVLNSPGTVDSTYQGEVKVIMFNHNEIPFTVVRGQKIAQAVLAPVAQAALTQIESTNATHPTHRGERGFGSTG